MAQNEHTYKVVFRKNLGINMNDLKAIFISYQCFIDVIKHLGISQWDVE